jgi:O-antigen/teichoic acid export membrane protein
VVFAISDWGLSQQALTKLAQLEGVALQTEVSDLIFSKAIVSLIALIAAVSYAAISEEVQINLTWISVLLAACAVSSIFDFFGMILRARSNYSNETRWSLFGTFLGNVIAGVVSIVSHNLLMVCATLIIFRIAALIGQIHSVRRTVNLSKEAFHLRNIKTQIRPLNSGSAFAFDSLSVQLFANIDVFLSRNFLSPVELGIYLAGTRLVQATLAGIPVIASVFIPILARESMQKKLIKSAFPLIASCAFAAIISILMFVIAREPLTLIVFGPQFTSLNHLMAIFGLAIAIRYISTIPSTWLSAKKKQVTRTYVNVSSILIGLAYIFITSVPLGIALAPIHFATFFLVSSLAQFFGYLIAYQIASEESSK